MRLRVIGLALVALLATGCAHNSTPMEPYDPYEDANRKVFNFNQGLDKYVLAPTASAYTAVTPGFFRQGVDNFFDNASYPGTILNDFLQGKVKQGFQDTGRFIVNTTVGLLGFFDPASAIGLVENDEDFGQTLATWGANSGPFLELPGLGPRYARHTADLPVATATNVLTYAVSSSVGWPLTVLYVINTRAMLDRAARIRAEAALDPYLFTRSAYMQYREQKIYDGNPPTEDLYDDSFFDELDEDAFFEELEAEEAVEAEAAGEPTEPSSAQ